MWADRVGSTQDIVHDLGADGAADGAAVVAGEQAEGRGSRGRAWQSPRGGLWLSVLARPANAAPAEALSVRVALYVAEALEAQGIPGVQLKWPNDLMLNGRKAGGILCEARWLGERLGWIAIGVGLNVANAVPPELRQQAMALAEVHPGMRPSDLALPIVQAVRAAAAVTSALDARELAGFDRRDGLAGRRVRSPVPGLAVGVAPDGALRIRRSDGVVELVRVGPAVAVSFQAD